MEALARVVRQSSARGTVAAMSVEVRDVAPGLWLWRQRHWEWREGDDWEPEVASFVVESGDEVVLLDPLAPPPRAREVWDRLEARPPTVAVVLKPDHMPDVDLVPAACAARSWPVAPA